ncbi:alpha/beta hydrolase [Actinopolymorpha sp. B17G11]|uniref:alpha/beta hydrolase n=1 Tax=unclassified Actinopolymorpha TaxID=2627063 RepID=UPI0032D93FA3
MTTPGSPSSSAPSSPAAASLSLEHRFVAGDPSAPVVLALHGTGGSPEDLMELARYLQPGAGVLAPAGPVSEHGAARWFRRLAEGVFDVDDVIARTHQLAEFVVAARQAYALGDRRIIALGFSNGANIAAATVLLRPDVLREAVLFAAMMPVPDPPDHDLSVSRIFLANGTRDPMAPLDSVVRLERALLARSVQVQVFRHDGGHQIPLDAAAAAREWVGTPGE